MERALRCLAALSELSRLGRRTNKGWESSVANGLRAIRHGSWRTAAANMALRGTSIALRFFITVYIVRELGFQAMAAYGFIGGAAAIMTEVTGLGVTYQITRICITHSADDTVWRLRDRFIQRLLVGSAVCTLGLATLWMLSDIPVWLTPSAVLILLLEPSITDIHQAFVFQHRPVAGNLVLALRSASWIPPVMAAGFLTLSLRSIEFIFVGWAMGLLATLAIALSITYADRVGRRGLARPIDWSWMKRVSTSSPIVYASEVGYAGLLYSDRFIVALLLGETAAGLFSFLWSLTGATVAIVQAGVLNQIAPRLASYWHSGHLRDWLSCFETGLRQATLMAAACGGVATLVTAVTLHFLHPVHLWTSITVASLMSAAVLVRTRADIVHAALYSAEQDSDWIAVNILGILIGPLIAVIGVAWFRFLGSGIEMVASALALYWMRQRLAQRIIGSTRTTLQTETRERIHA